MKSVSAIVRTKNSGATLASCLSALLNQTIVPQIIVVDSGSADDTLQICASFQVIVVELPKDTVFNYAHAINTGIMASSGEAIMVISSHVILRSEFVIERMLKLLSESPEVVAVSAKRIKDNTQTYTEELEIIDKQSFYGRAMYNYCSLLRRADWSLRKFNEEIPTAEDQEWVWHFLQQGRRAIIYSGAQVLYLNPYYNFNKDVREYVTIGRYVSPGWIAPKHLFKKFLKNFKLLSMFKWNSFYQNQRFIIAVIAFVLFDKQVKGTYNRKLK